MSISTRTEKQLAALKEKGILEEIEGELVYSPTGEAFFAKDGDRNYYGTSAAHVYMVSQVGECPALYSWQFRGHCIDWLYEIHFPPQVTFANGKVRATFVRNLVKRLENGEGAYKLVAKKRCQQLSENWENVPENLREVVSPYFTADGLYAGDLKNLPILQENGDFRYEFVSLSDVVQISPLTLPIVRAGYIKKVNLGEQCTVMFRGEETLVYEFEMPLINRSLVKCSECGSYEYLSQMVFNTCSKCAGDFPKELEGYSTRATDRFVPIEGKGKYSPRLTGVELEYELGGNLRDTLYLLHRNLKNHALFKRDGSLSDGIEICTRPASVNIHLEEFQKMFNDSDCMERLLVESTCGMHVHIDKRKMTPLTLGKMIQFMQDSKNMPFLSTIAGRENNRYAKLGTNHSVTSLHRGQISDRYQGVNLQNAHTIELRIFKTPNTFEAFLKNMEFVDALSSFVLPANSGVKETNFESFMKYVNDHRSTYRELTKFIKENF